MLNQFQMNRILLIKMFLLIGISLQAQTKMISGKIIVDDAHEVINLEGFSILNTSSGAYTKANNNGLFSINVKENDKLIFRQNGIAERSIIVSESLLKKGFIEVHLNVEVIELKETNIAKLDFNKLNNLGKNKSINEKLKDEMGINSSEFKKKVIQQHEFANFHRKANPYAGNILELVKLFKTPNGKGIFDRKRVSAFEQVNDLKSIIGETYFIRELNIPREQIIDFYWYEFFYIQVR
jgi:hypothetical protein